MQAPAGAAVGMDADLSEEDQMMRAIAMSLGENVVMSADQVRHHSSVFSFLGPMYTCKPFYFCFTNTHTRA